MPAISSTSDGSSASETTTSSFLPYWEETGLSAAREDVKVVGWRKPGKLMLLVANLGEAGTVKVEVDPQQLGWDAARSTVTDMEQGYKQYGNQRVEKTPEELATERRAWEERMEALVEQRRKAWERHVEQAKKQGNPAPAKPDLTPRSFPNQKFKNVRLLGWDGDENEPVQQNGSSLQVPLKRHNYRLLLLERQ